MLAAALTLALAISSAPPQQDALNWGRSEWVHGTGPASGHQFQYGTAFPSAYFLQYGTASGSFYYLLFGNGPGSSYFWEYGDTVASAYYWRHGRGEGSRYFWTYGRGCLSEEGWRSGTTCSPSSLVTLHTLCVARAVEIEPCRQINAGLEGWLGRTSGFSMRDPVAVIARMREAVGE